MSAAFSLALYFHVSLKKAAVKLSLANKDRVVEGLANSCSWIEFLCFRSNLVYFWTLRFSSDLEHLASVVCKWLFSWDQQGCILWCFLLTQSHYSLSSWTWSRAGQVATHTATPPWPLCRAYALAVMALAHQEGLFLPIWLHAMKPLKLSLLDLQNRLLAVLKENSNWTIKFQLIIFLAAVVFCFYCCWQTIYHSSYLCPLPQGCCCF